MKTAPTYFEYWAERYRRRALDKQRIHEYNKKIAKAILSDLIGPAPTGGIYKGTTLYG